jgi:hypothetical protein
MGYRYAILQLRNKVHKKMSNTNNDDDRILSQEEIDEMREAVASRRTTDQMWGWKFDEPLGNILAEAQALFGTGWKAVDYLIERCRRAESRAPKQYTVKELRHMYKEQFSKETGETNTWTGGTNTWDGFLAAAKLFGKVTL